MTTVTQADEQIFQIIKRHILDASSPDDDYRNSRATERIWLANCWHESNDGMSLIKAVYDRYIQLEIEQFEATNCPRAYWESIMRDDLLSQEQIYLLIADPDLKTSINWDLLMYRCLPSIFSPKMFGEATNSSEAVRSTEEYLIVLNEYLDALYEDFGEDY